MGIMVFSHSSSSFIVSFARHHSSPTFASSPRAPMASYSPLGFPPIPSMARASSICSSSKGVVMKRGNLGIARGSSRESEGIVESQACSLTVLLQYRRYSTDATVPALQCLCYSISATKETVTAFHLWICPWCFQHTLDKEVAVASEFADMPALRGKDYGKTKMRYPDYTEQILGFNTRTCELVMVHLQK
uniref:Uncharacterized protein n=1 Tax=Ananas comosus var. bracteatus TaxID=296719 RepID=A0A6V7NPF2_ANACO|nr:unnamed protein product [Ananas comosus var. bracteatus]